MNGMIALQERKEKFVLDIRIFLILFFFSFFYVSCDGSTCVVGMLVIKSVCCHNTSGRARLVQYGICKVKWLSLYTLRKDSFLYPAELFYLIINSLIIRTMGSSMADLAASFSSLFQHDKTILFKIKVS